MSDDFVKILFPEWGMYASMLEKEAKLSSADEWDLGDGKFSSGGEALSLGALISCWTTKVL